MYNNEPLVYCGDLTFRHIDKGGKKIYYVLSICDYCGQDYLTLKYNPAKYCSNSCKLMSGTSTVGRPIGLVLGNNTKQKIAQGRTGKTHNDITRQKISKTVKESLKKSKNTKM